MAVLNMMIISMKNRISTMLLTHYQVMLRSSNSAIWRGVIATLNNKTPVIKTSHIAL